MMSASVSRRLLLSLGGSILKSDRRRTLTCSNFNNYHFQTQQLCTNYTSISGRRSYCSSSISAAASIDVDDDCCHPWPEWVSFVDRLKAKGYFKSQSDDVDDGVESAAFAADVYKDMNQLKDACLTFARDRYDLLKSLSKSDIQAVVECGCPNLLRKAVNSAKRLRVFMRLDEGDVCGACNLRGSCDRAYGILKESEADARTVDLMRILLFYALDPLVFAPAEKTPAPGRDLVELSTKKLLSQLIQLSETSLDPQLPKPATKATKKKIPYEDTVIPYQDFSNTPTIEMKRGDWMCPKCSFMNFSRNMQCRQCKEDGPKNSGTVDAEIKKGDWICSECTFVNFARNVRCLKCKSEGPKRVDVNDAVMKKGDWNCPKCQFMNFSSNTKCLRCREGRPKRQLNPGEWECPSCDFLNFRKNMACRKCNCERPKESATKYEEHEWNPDS